jgi:hypothetical protein
MVEKIKPSVERIMELRESIGVLAARRMATREEVLAAIESANDLDDIKRILVTMMDLD